MQRHSDLSAFYNLLADLENRIGGKRRLGDCTGRMSWPKRGVYFFFEPQEYRTNSRTISRVVRVGTHAITEKSQTTIWNRLSQHRGSVKSGGGNHRGSIFRLLVGEALMAKDAELVIDTWGHGSSAAREIKQSELTHEIKVSEYLAEMQVLFLPVLDAASPASQRGIIEQNSIALLSCYLDPTAEQPSGSWLGHYSRRQRVRRSGLWNNQHVDEAYDPTFLRLLKQLVGQIDCNSPPN